jgi:hypothetical protein
MKRMLARRLLDAPLRSGFVLGVVFGAINLVLSWFRPLSDDSVGALLRFYGPMFFAWGFVAFRAARLSGQWWHGVAAGAIVAFGTFCVFDVLNLARVNVFLADLTGRADWQSMMERFKVSGSDSLRVFVTVEYLKDAPLKIGVASTIGAIVGAIGGAIGCVRFSRVEAISYGSSARRRTTR